MKYYQRFPLFFCLFLLFASTFFGCGKPATSSGPVANNIPISVKQTIPEAIIGEPYKLFSLVKKEKNVTYTFSASYVDPVSGQVKELSVKNDRITPVAEADITVTVTASRGIDSSTAEFVIPVYIATDVMDVLLSAQSSTDQVEKSITRDKAFLHTDASISSLKLQFSNSSNADNGTALINLSSHSLNAYYTARVWHNAAVSFWVYNPTNQTIFFKLAVHNSNTGTILSWNSAENTQLQTAVPQQWTNVVFSLYDMGISTPLIDTETDTVPSLQLLARCEGNDACTVYIDDLDIVPADSIEGLSTGYTTTPIPSGDYSDLLSKCSVYTKNPDAKLSVSTKGNGTNTAYHFSSGSAIGYPTMFIDLPKTTDISGFDYLKLDVYAENVHPWISVAVHYLDQNGEIQKHGTAYDFYQNQWRSIFVNLDYLNLADLTQVVGFSITVNLDSNYQAGGGLYFDNVSLYTYPDNQPQMTRASIEDNDIISGPFVAGKTKPNISGVCKVATDETGLKKSNSTLLFWTNNAYGYPSATFTFDKVQDWSEYTMLNFDTHQSNAHFWMRFEIIYLDENGTHQTLTWHNDTMFNHWLTTSAALSWFTAADGSSAQAEQLKQVVAFRITVDLFVHITDEVGMIFFDNINLS